MYKVEKLKLLEISTLTLFIYSFHIFDTNHHSLIFVQEQKKISFFAIVEIFSWGIIDNQINAE